MVRTEQTEPTVDEMVEEADEEESVQEEEGGEDRSDAEPGEMTRAQVRQVLSKAEELKDMLVEFDPKVDRSFEFVGQFSTLLEPYSVLFKNYIATEEQALITKYFRQPRPDSPPPVDEADIDDVMAQSEDDDAVSTVSAVDFEGFSDSD